MSSPRIWWVDRSDQLSEVVTWTNMILEWEEIGDRHPLGGGDVTDKWTSEASRTLYHPLLIYSNYGKHKVPENYFLPWSPAAFCCDSCLLFLTITQNCMFSVLNFVVFVFETSITTYLPSPFFLQILPYAPPCFPSNSLKAFVALIFTAFRKNESFLNITC